MAEYIEREAIFREIERRESLMVGDKLVSVDAMKSFIKNRPAADVAPVRHGRWEKQNGLYSCSECGMTCPYDVQADVIEYWSCNYCPNCGAKMDKPDEPEN